MRLLFLRFIRRDANLAPFLLLATCCGELSHAGPADPPAPGPTIQSVDQNPAFVKKLLAMLNVDSHSFRFGGDAASLTYRAVVEERDGHGPWRETWSTSATLTTRLKAGTLDVALIGPTEGSPGPRLVVQYEATSGTATSVAQAPPLWFGWKSLQLDTKCELPNRPLAIPSGEECVIVAYEARRGPDGEPGIRDQGHSIKMKITARVDEPPGPTVAPRPRYP